MPDYYSKIIPPIIAGIFAIISAYFAWKLKKQSEELSQKNKKHEEIKELYLSVFELFEKTTHEVRKIECNIPHSEFHKTHAKIHLLASDSVAKLYDEACSTLQDWISLHFKSTPPTQKFGDHYVTTIQAPDPTAKYKEPAQKAYDVYRVALNSLTEQMKKELKEIT